MSNKDIITGKWKASYFTRRGVDYVKTKMNAKGYDSITHTYEANSVLGFVKNIRTTSSGHTKATLAFGGRKLATAIIHKKIDVFGSYDDGLSGRFILDTRSMEGKFWDPSLANHWLFKTTYNL